MPKSIISGTMVEIKGSFRFMGAPKALSRGGQREYSVPPSFATNRREPQVKRP
jgi:hypothetical protein